MSLEGTKDKTEAISRAPWVTAGVGARASVLVLSGDERSGLQSGRLMGKDETFIMTEQA